MDGIIYIRYFAMEGANQLQKLQEEAQGILARFKELQNSPNWKENGTKPCPMYKMEVDKRVAAKGIATVNYPFDKVVDFLWKDDTLSKLNSQVIEIKVLFDQEGLKVNYQQYKAVWPVANRDFVILISKVPEGQGKIYMGSKSCSFPYPEVKGVVRGDVNIGGYIVEKIDEQNCKVTYISDANLNGNIPQMVQNKLASGQGEVAGRVFETMKKSGY